MTWVLSVKKLFITITFVVLPFMGQPLTTLSVNVDSLMEIIESGESPESLVYEAYIQLAWELKSIKPNQSLGFAQNALQIAEKKENLRDAANALSIIGVIYWQMGNFRMALDYHLEANSLFRDIDYEIGIARSNTNMGIIFSDQSHYEEALEYFYEALRIYESNQDTLGMAAVLNNIGMVYEHQKDYDLAERHHLQSLELKEQLKDERGMSFSYNNLGLVYQRLEETELAQKYFYKSLEIRLELNDKREIANTTSNLGNLYFQLEDYEKSDDYLTEALNLYAEVNDKSGLAKTYNYLGRLHIETNNLDRARDYFNQSMEIAEDIGLTRMITENYVNLAKVMALYGDYQAAYNYQQLYDHIKDSIYSEESRRKIIELQLMYDREKRESEMELLKKNQEISFLSTQRDRLLRNFLIIGVVLILISLFLLYNRFLIASKANVLLEKQKAEITETNSQLVELNHSLLEQKKRYEELNRKLHQSNEKLMESEKHLMETNATKDKFFSIISHDLRNPFASIVSFSRILKRDISSMSKDELSELAYELDKSVLKINNLLENLLQWSRTQTGKIKYKPEYMAVHEIVKDNLNLFKNNAKEKNVKLMDEVDDDLPVFADRNMTDTVIRNLLSNALKYTDVGGEIKISSYVHDHMAYISVKDNGVGISQENKKKIFRVDSLHSTYGTMDEKGSGLGLLLCKEFVEKQGGYITFKSEQGKGSEFTFSLPLEDKRA